MGIAWILFQRSWAASCSSAAWDFPSTVFLTSPSWWSDSVPWTSWWWLGTGWRLWICAVCYEWVTLRVLIYGELLETSSSLSIYLSIFVRHTVGLLLFLRSLSPVCHLSVCYYSISSDFMHNAGSIYNSNVIRSPISKSQSWQQHGSICSHRWPCR